MRKTYQLFAVTIDEVTGHLIFVDRTGKDHKVKVTHECAREINDALSNGKPEIVQRPFVDYK